MAIQSSVATVPADVTNSDDLRSFLSRVGEEINLVVHNTAVPASSLPTVTISGAYAQSEIQTLAAQIQTLQVTVNSLITRLQTADILL